MCIMQTSGHYSLMLLILWDLLQRILLQNLSMLLAGISRQAAIMMAEVEWRSDLSRQRATFEVPACHGCIIPAVSIKKISSDCLSRVGVWILQNIRTDPSISISQNDSPHSLSCTVYNTQHEAGIEFCWPPNIEGHPTSLRLVVAARFTVHVTIIIFIIPILHD